MFEKIVGWSFYAACPFVGPALLLTLYIGNTFVPMNQAAYGFAAYTVAWLYAFAAWFDNSRFQRAL